MKARITGIITAAINIAFVIFVVWPSVANAQVPEAVALAKKSGDGLLDLGVLGIFCVILILANGLQFYGSYLERKEHKAELKAENDAHRLELKDRNDLLAAWAAQTTKAVADATAATSAAAASTMASTIATTKLTEQMARSDIATARAVDRLEKMETSAAHGTGGRS